MSKKTGIFFLCLLYALCASAQEKVEMADALRTDGKIYVVLVSILMILGGLFFYLVKTERSLKSLEDKLDKK